MITDPTLLFISSIAVANIVLAIVLLVLVVAYVRVARKLELYKIREEDMSKKAQEEKDKIVKQAEDEAARIMADTKVLSHKNQQELFARLSKAQEAIIQRLARENISISQNINKVAKQQIEESADNLKRALEKATLGLEKEAKEKVRSRYETTLQEIEKYKEEQLVNVEGRVSGIIRELAKEVLGKSISMEDHEELVIEALEKAKRSLQGLV